MKAEFKQRVSMEVTVEQYEKDLKEPLEKLGYEWLWGSHDEESSHGISERYPCVIANYQGSGNIGSQTVSYYNRGYYIDHYNPKLFLALTGMREGDEIHVGEYVKSDFRWLEKVIGFHQKGVLSLEGRPKSQCHVENYRKATKEELINHFTKNKSAMENTIGRILKPSDAQRIINIACSSWKNRLAALWAVSIVKNQDIVINESFYKEMRKECTEPQHELFDEIFGKDEAEQTYKYGDVFMDNEDELAMLCQTDDNMACLICLSEPIEVNDESSITHEELKKMNGKIGTFFTKVDVDIKVK